ncbi:5300_t:CDS:1, partial [Cetraspora pellucida]
DISHLLKKDEVLTDEMLKVEYTTPKTILKKRLHPSFMSIPDLKSSNFEDKLY